MSNTKITDLPWSLIKVKRDQHLKNLIAASEIIETTCHQYYPQRNLTYCPVPQIVGITGACENVDTLFKISNQRALPLFFSQTGQLMLEFVLQYYNGVYTIIHSGRDEYQEDSRHLLEFLLIEEEFGWPLVTNNPSYDENKMFEYLLQRIEKATKAIVRELLHNQRETLEQDYDCRVDDFLKVLTQPYWRVSYDEAITILQHQGYAELCWGDDLKPEHEAKIVEYCNQPTDIGPKDLSTVQLPVLVTKYPKEIKFFNMMVSSDDHRVVLSADLLVPKGGEAVGSAVREHNGRKLRERLLASTMYRLHLERGGTYQDFTWYVEDIVGAEKTPPHAGYGLGVSRLLQWVFGLADIRLCSLFSIMAEQTGDFSDARAGMAPMISHQKTILLSIADDVKKDILPQIAGHLNGDLVLYATAGTHDFLKELGVPTTLVYKVAYSEKPNLAELMKKRVFDIVINIPSSRSQSAEDTDGDMIRRLAIDNGVYLITDLASAKYLLQKLAVQTNSSS